MSLPFSAGTSEKLRGCLLKFFDCWKPPSCSLRAVGTVTGCCCHCQPGEATVQLDPSLAVFWLKTWEMESAHPQGGPRASGSQETRMLLSQALPPVFDHLSCPSSSLEWLKPQGSNFVNKYIKDIVQHQVVPVIFGIEMTPSQNLWCFWLL